MKFNLTDSYLTICDSVNKYENLTLSAKPGTYTVTVNSDSVILANSDYIPYEYFYHGPVSVPHNLLVAGYSQIKDTDEESEQINRISDSSELLVETVGDYGIVVFPVFYNTVEIHAAYDKELVISVSLKFKRSVG